MACEEGVFWVTRDIICGGCKLGTCGMGRGAGWFWQCDSVCQSNKAEYDAVMLQYNGLLNEERQHWSDAKAGPRCA